MNKVARKAKQLKYEWADSIYRSKMPRCKADVAYNEIEKVRSLHRGKAKPEDLVHYAKAQRSSPLHKMFDWNVTSAAREHWLSTARLIMRSIVVVREGGPSHKAYFQINESKVRFYTTASEVMSNRQWAEQLLAEAESYYLAGAARFNAIQELAKLHGIIRKTFNASSKKAA